MRRRDMYSNVVWFGRFTEDGDTGMVQRALGKSAPTLAESLHELSRIGYLTEVEQTGETYLVRCWPMAMRMPLAQPRIALSYSGTNLASILATAALDAQDLRDPSRHKILRTREAIRWVP